MKLYIYRLEGCKTCMKRQDTHNQLALMLNKQGIDVEGVKFGMIDGKRVEPLEDHDQLCRKEDDQMKYTAPVYILEGDDFTVKLPDLSKFLESGNGLEDYVNSVLNIAYNNTQQ